MQDPHNRVLGILLFVWRIRSIIGMKKSARVFREIGVVAELEKLNKKADVIIGIMQKPVNKLYKIMEIVGNVVGIISILAIVELIRNWIIGG